MGDLVDVLHAEAYLTVHQDPKKPPVELPRPWGAKKGAAEQVSADERSALVARLKANSAFGDG